VVDSVTGLRVEGARIRVLDLPAVTSAADGTFSVAGSRAETCHIDYLFSIEVSAARYVGFSVLGPGRNLFPRPRL
jgi:hypothetical protein